MTWRRATTFFRWHHLLLLFAATCASVCAQPIHAQQQSAKATAPVLLLSDIHLDPFHDPAKVARLASLPAEQWDGVLNAPDSPTQAKDFAELQEVCHLRGVDTQPQLWRSSLEAMRREARGAAFVAVSGDLLAHNFECKFKRIVPSANEEDYLRFVVATMQYIVRGLRLAFPATPVYVALGNNDSACGDYKDDRSSAFLAGIAKILTQALPPGEGVDIQRDFSREGYYNAPMPAAFPGGRMIVLDDLFLSAKHSNCAGKPDEAATAAVTEWLETQLAEAHAKGQHVWVMGHIPPGIDLYSTLRRLENVCKVEPVMFLENEKMASVLAAHADVVRLAVFGHSHTDELRLLGKDDDGSGVPVKIVASISPVNGNNPSFMIGHVNRRTAQLTDYTVSAASNITGAGTVWAKEYTFSETYHQPAFSAAALKQMTDEFRVDELAVKPESAAYLRNLYVGDRSPLLKPFWPEYVCALTHHTAASYAKCVCAN